MLSRAIVLKIASWRFVERTVRHARIFRRVVSRFIAGNTLDEALATVESLAEKGYYVSLDYLGEAVTSVEEAVKAKDIYIEMFDHLAMSPCFRSPIAPRPGVTVHPSPFAFGGGSVPVETANVSIKLTQCGLALSDELAEKHYREVSEVARKYGSFLNIDMEDSPFTERTIRLVEKVRRDNDCTGTVLQSYLFRTPKDVEWSIDHQVRIRLVKGAYLEPSSVAIQKMKDIDAAFVAEGKRLLDAGAYPAFGTHNERLLNELVAYAKQKSIAKDRFEIQMLYGIRRDLQERFLKEGYIVRIYFPFGDGWYPYFSRRIAERPANAFFIVKALFRK